MEFYVIGIPAFGNADRGDRHCVIPLSNYSAMLFRLDNEFALINIYDFESMIGPRQDHERVCRRLDFCTSDHKHLWPII